MTPDLATVSMAVMGSYPPAVDHTAAQTKGLLDALAAAGVGQVSVVRVGADNPPIEDPRVISQLRPSWQASPNEAVRALNAHHLVMLQHAFTGPLGEDHRTLLEVLDALEVPMIATVHEVPAAPTRTEQEVLAKVVARADCTVVPSAESRARLQRGLEVDPERLRVIPHGAWSPRPSDHGYDPTTIITPGCVAPGAGVEWMIEALAAMGDTVPPVRYLVSGPDAPEDAASGAYRRTLVQLARARGLGARVVFDERRRSPIETANLLAHTACVVLPHDALDTAVAPSLTDALAAGVPVVATAFDHARELLASGGGILVNHHDAAGLAVAVCEVVTRTGVRAELAAQARRIGERSRWPQVADAYLQLLTEVRGSRATHYAGSVGS